MGSTDKDYLAAIKGGDVRGLNEIYRQFLPRINKLITSKGGTSDDAKDVFQDAIIVIYEKSKDKNFKLTSGFYTLLHGICRNIWGNRLQKKSRTEVTIPDDNKYTVSTDIEKTIQQEEENKVFWQAFRKLGKDCQKLMQLFFEKQKMQEIMKIMGYGSVSYAKKRKFQCKERLVDLVKSDRRYGELRL